jgi:hypothetical protein
MFFIYLFQLHYVGIYIGVMLAHWRICHLCRDLELFVTDEGYIYVSISCFVFLFLLLKKNIVHKTNYNQK